MEGRMTTPILRDGIRTTSVSAAGTANDKATYRVTISLPEDLAERLKSEAARTGKTYAEIVRGNLVADKTGHSTPALPPGPRDLEQIAGDFGCFTFVTSIGVAERFHACCALLQIDPSKLLCEAVNRAIASTLTRLQVQP